jgi:asparagine synthase (glutamine-hydrolysing)
MTKHIGSNHKNVGLSSLKVAESLEEATVARDLPGMADIDSSLLLFCKEVKKQNTVCVSGECADEIFGGYPWYHNPEILFADSFPWSKSIALRQKLFNLSFLGKDSEDFVHSEYQRTVNSTAFLPSDSKFERRMREMFMLNFNWFMQTLLERKDRMSMYAGLEVRVPFCDYRLVEYAYNMPWELKSLPGREKGIIREAFKDTLPEEIVFRKKSPYPKTFDPIFLSYVKNKAKELVADKNSVLCELVNKEFFSCLLENSKQIENPWYGQLMREPQIFAYLIQLDTFFKIFKLNLV